MILNLGGASAGGGARSARRRGGLETVSTLVVVNKVLENTYIRLSWVIKTLMAFVMESVSGERP